MNLGKKIFVLIFLLIILVGVFVIQNEDLGQEYFTWLKNKIIGLRPELNLTEQDSGLDLSTVNLANVLDKDPVSIQEDEPIEEITTNFEEVEIPSQIEETNGIGGPIPGTEEEISLEEIKEQVDRITIEVERITEEVKNLVSNVQ